MALVTTANCSILLNGAPSKTFKPSRGLKQGDPLSPFLFILMMEGLGRAIRAAKEEGRIQGLRLTHGVDTVTHQQFVDDTMLHGTPTVKEAKAFKQILSEFSRAVGTEEDNLQSEELVDIHTDTINKGLRWVSDYWAQIRNDKKWRTWKLLDYSGMGMLHAQATTLQGLLDKRQILNSNLNDQLRWGKNKTGLFNLKEAKRIDAGLDLNIDKTWKETWENPHWMKVKLFKWLVQQGKILTWDNLRKRGFGPSRCHLRKKQEETTNHLLNRCTFTTILWNWVGEVFEQTDKNANDITTTLKNWWKNILDNEIINSTWMLTPGFIIWNVWKECNNRIFKEKTSPMSSILNLILK
eukprot:PITA_04682